ncbi:hypothetical protein Patl1_10407 [Pistacia atlantica]|uniref:Uncharacterized protein n=1 Tax=Pistacia atlantica TaxID=434234 RepID=A0ACC1A6R8_9ROSI|nr:hypothetical protein Patl1_10407 [Pistacia atlantica]
MRALSNQDDDKITKEKKEEEKKLNRVLLLKLFTFVDFYDRVLMALGSIGAIIHGVSVLVFFIYFGKMINIIGLAYLAPKIASHKIAKVSKILQESCGNYVFIMARGGLLDVHWRVTGSENEDGVLNVNVSKLIIEQPPPAAAEIGSDEYTLITMIVTMATQEVEKKSQDTVKKLLLYKGNEEFDAMVEKLKDRLKVVPEEFHHWLENLGKMKREFLEWSMMMKWRALN